MKKNFTGAALGAAAAGAFMLSGCCGYQGFADYETQTEISRGKEKITGEKISLQIEKGKFTVEKVQDFTYDQQLRVDSKRGFIYTEGSGVQVIGNCIFYPFTLVFSPLRLLAMNDKKQNEFGHEYLYSSGRQAWNMFNPFICTMGKFKLEEETLSSKNKTATRSETRRIPIKDGQLQLTFGKQKKTFPVSVTLPEICKTVFDYPLPEKTAAVSVTYNGKSYPLTLKSTMTLSPEELAAWNSILNCKTSEQAMDGNGSASLEKLHESKKLGDSSYKAEKARLEALVETLKFPMRKISDNRIPLSKEYVSGTSFLWFEAQFLRGLREEYKEKAEQKVAEYKAEQEKSLPPLVRKNKDFLKKMRENKDFQKKMQAKITELRQIPDDAELCKEIRRKCRKSQAAFDSFFYRLPNSEALIFSCGEPFSEENISKSVLVRREMEMPSGITLKMAVDNIMKKNPGVTAKKTTKSLGKNSRTVNGGSYGLAHFTVENMLTEVEISNARQKWTLSQVRIIKHCKASKELLREIEQAGENLNGVTEGKITVIISDRKLEETFEKMHKDFLKKEQQRKKQQQQDMLNDML